MRRALAAAAAVSLILAAGAAAKPPPLSPVQVKTSFASPYAFFGDHVSARVDVLVDRTRVDPGSVIVDASFGDWEQLGETRTALVETAAAARRTALFTIACVAVKCLPKGPILQPASLPPVVVTARAVDGSIVTVRQPWSLEVAGRLLPPTSGGGRPLLRGQTEVPSPTYRVDPSSLALALDLVGLIALVIAIGFAALELGRWWLRRGHALDRRPPLVRALALLREAQGRDVEDRRRAAGLVARLLREGSTAEAAAAVAWSRAEPTPHVLEKLAAKAESSVEEPA